MNVERKIYLDNIRGFTVILVMIYHAFYIFNGVGVLGGFYVEKGLALLDAVCTLVYPWFMLLLFCISGISTRYSLKKKGVKGFIRDRINKLLIPSTLGLFALHWITGYINIKIGGGLEYIPDFLVYPISAISGIGPLWFSQLVLLFSFLFALIFKVDRKDSLYNLVKNIPSFVLPLLAAVIWGSSQILNMPLLTMYRFGIYLLGFAIGYFVLSHENTLKKIEKILPVTLSLGILLGVKYMILFFGENYTSDTVLKNVITNFYAWIVVLAIFGLGRKYMNKHNKISKYISVNSFALYILHYPVLMVVAYHVYNHAEFSLSATITVVLIAEFVITFLAAEVIKRIPIIRYFILGIYRRKNEIQINN